jgi:hypothetical protein
MSWTHNICLECWSEKNPDRQVVKLIGEETVTCCFCGKDNHDGIFIRHNPNLLICKGEHNA